MIKPVYILGISAYYHDSAACLLKDGAIVAAAQEERFSRKKHDAAFCRRAIDYCLKEAGIGTDEIDYVAFYEKPFLKFERLLLTYLSFAPLGLSSFVKAMPLWLKERIFLKEEILSALGVRKPVLFPLHHESHAASAFFPSPFKEAAVLTLDGVGEWTTASIGEGRGNKMTLLQEMKFPHSLGLLYSAFTYYVGFRVNSGEYKLMGLAPYGRPVYADLIRRHLIDIKEDGSFRLNVTYFGFPCGLTMINSAFEGLLGNPARRPEEKIEQFHMDVARSIQEIAEEVMLKMAGHARALTGAKNLCLAGGAALNCVANAKILKEAGFEKIWIQPASGDAGGALGAAMLAWHHFLERPRFADGVHDLQQGSLLGPRQEDIRTMADQNGWVYEHVDEEKLPQRIAGLLNEQKVVGICRGRMEFGPRALGSRSIIADPRDEAMAAKLNLKIKFREPFRPFAPVVLKERCRDYFDLQQESPYMLLTAPVKGEQIPAVTHVDHSARVQTVDEHDHPFFYSILKAFEQLTGCAVLINTSFNVRGEPVVCSSLDSYRCFMSTEMDYLLVGQCLFDRQKQPGQGSYNRELIAVELD